MSWRKSWFLRTLGGLNTPTLLGMLGSASKWSMNLLEKGALEKTADFPTPSPPPLPYFLSYNTHLSLKNQLLDIDVCCKWGNMVTKLFVTQAAGKDSHEHTRLSSCCLWTFSPCFWQRLVLQKLILTQQESGLAPTGFLKWSYKVNRATLMFCTPSTAAACAFPGKILYIPVFSRK